jgi:monooxygenase
LEADIIVTATGLNMVLMGEMQFSVDGEAVDYSKTWTYKGLMTTGVPNVVNTFGYINASWTLRADITAEWVCRVLNHMDATGTRQVVPVIDDALAEGMVKRPWIDDFSSGYMARILPAYPVQGDQAPWLNPQDYAKDKKMFRQGSLDDGDLKFTVPNAAPVKSEQRSAA